MKIQKKETSRSTACTGRDRVNEYNLVFVTIKFPVEMEYIKEKYYFQITDRKVEGFYSDYMIYSLVTIN